MNTKTLKPFDLEKALAGDPVLYCEHPINFIGMSKCRNYAVIEDNGGSSASVFYAALDNLRMAPKKVTRWVNLRKECSLAFHHATKETAEMEATIRPECYIAIAIPVEIEE